jgi:hypothetical protein
MTTNEQNNYSVNFKKLLDNLHYITINGEIIGDNLEKILKSFKSPIESTDVAMSCKWSKYKECNICTMNDEPLFFVKELWQPQFMREVLGVHLGMLLDDQMSFNDYLFGMWNINEKKQVPAIITPYLPGSPLKKKQFKQFKYQLGKQYAFHEILALYDVEWRHFILNENTLSRIDLGRCFSNLDMKYQGFWSFKYEKKLKGDSQFEKGLEDEREILKNNIEKYSSDIKNLIGILEIVGKENNSLLDFNLEEFLPKLKKYWSEYLSFNLLKEISYLD